MWFKFNTCTCSICLHTVQLIIQRPSYSAPSYSILAATSEAYMTDYTDYREASRDPAFVRPADPLAIRGSVNRNSLYSHGSVSASTRSWVYSTQQNPPPPPEPITLPSPVRTLRPLPDPQLQPQHHHPVYHLTNAGEEEEEEEEYMNIDPNDDEIDTGYRTEGLGRGRSPMVPSSRPDDSGSRSFVGGFVRGLRRLPKVVLRYGGNGDKRKFFRRGTLGTEGTATSITGMTGNTLPRYTSNPSTPVAGPSNTQYFQHEQMSMPQPAPFPPGATSNGQRRRNPSFRVTPPSELVEQEENGLEYVSESPAQLPAPLADSSRDVERATVMLYQDAQQDVAVPPSRPASTPLRRSDSAHVRHSEPVSVRRSDSHRQPSDAGAANQPPEQVDSPVLAHPVPASDYRKMGSLVSPTSPTTLTTATFTSEPSFSSELHPVKRFFTTLYHMPWIARDRVTVDYRPGGSRGARRGVVKKPMMSWYKGTPGVVTSGKTGSGSLDLLSSGGSESRRESAATGPTPLASPVAERAKPRSDRHRHSRRDRHHRRDRDRDRRRERRSRRRDTFSTAATAEMHHIRSTSPIVPTAYPYPYPYPYTTYPSFAAPPPVEPTYSTPRGPRSHRAPTFPHGYIPYQPPPPVPPMYVIHSSTGQTHASGSGSGDTSHGQLSTHGQMLSPVYMQMQLVPGSFNAEGARSSTSSPVAKPASQQAT
jgi:hypothetical protein